MIVVATGAVTTLAGAPGSGGSANGIGAAARFSGPLGVASDGAGNLFVADTGNQTIRKIVISSRTVTTLAGTAGQAGSADGAGAAARFNDPSGIAVDGGNLFVADTRNHTIRRVAIATGAVTTLAGVAASLSAPISIASDGAGNLFVADVNDAVVRKVVIATRAVTTLAGIAGQYGAVDGIGTAAGFNGPASVTSDGAGNLFVGDSNLVRKVVIQTGVVSTVLGSPGWQGVSVGGLPISLTGVSGIAVLPTGDLAIVDAVENAVLIGHL